MQSKHEAIVRLVNSKDRPLNILTFPTHEAYQTNLGELPHTFYLGNGNNIKKWNYKFRPLPKNHVMMGTSIPNFVKIDLVLSQNKFGQFEIAKKVADSFCIPLINLEHTLPPADWNDKHLKLMQSMQADTNVFITDFQRGQWKWEGESELISCCVNTSVFTPNDDIIRNDKVFTVVNDYINRDQFCGWSIYKQLTENTFETMAYGETPGFSRPAKDINELIHGYRSCGVFLNTSTWSTMPNTLLEAMACGTPVVTTATCSIPEIVQDGINGFCSNDMSYLKEKLHWCLENPEKAKELGAAARQTMIERYSLSTHLDKWEQIIRKTVNNYKGH